MKRKGFTLIELMVVIAIIIILAAVAIPNYINMTARAKKSRVFSNMAVLASSLGTFYTDWSEYPVLAAAANVATAGNVIHGELSGTAGALKNVSPNVTAGGDAAPISYMGTNTLKAMTTEAITYSGTTSTYVLSCTVGGVTYTRGQDDSIPHV